MPKSGTPLDGMIAPSDVPESAVSHASHQEKATAAAPIAPDTIAVGSRVQVARSGLSATVRFAGTVVGLPAGRWLGIALDTPAGKHDGEVKGKRLFRCAPGHGLLLRPAAVCLLAAGGTASSVGAAIRAPLAPLVIHTTAAPPTTSRKTINGGRRTVADFQDEFQAMVAEAAASVTRPTGAVQGREGVIDAKAANAANGLETSTFTICARIRPVLPHEEGVSECFAVIAPKAAAANTGLGAAPEAGADYTEEVLVMTPKVSLRGEPTLAKTSTSFDYVFGPDEDAAAVYAAVGRPLTARALAGQVGVVFAYGQTGSGKTHTMNGLLDGMLGQLFEAGDARAVSFRYFEVLGAALTDCMRASGGKGKEPTLKIGEGLDGGIVVKGLSTHRATSAAELQRLVAVAQARRSTAATERNDASSRSHGIAIIRVGQPGSAVACDGQEVDTDAPADGVLYVIDLAGSERAADSKGHTKQRMDETKQINLSLMALKDCIRARTLASAPGAGRKVHVPFRRSKLTLILKDVFDFSCARICSTVVIAAASPLARDVAHAADTLKYAAPLRVAVRNEDRTNLERDPNDPALWSPAEIVTWLQALCAAPPMAPATANHADHAMLMQQASAGYGGGDGQNGPETAHAKEVEAARGRKAAAAAAALRAAAAVAAAEAVMGADAARTASSCAIDAAALAGGLTGVQLCGLPEPEIHRRVQLQLPGAPGAGLAKRIHTALWTLIVDAKTRGRRPDGSIISAEDEAEERAAAEAAQRATAAVWAERTKMLEQGPH